MNVCLKFGLTLYALCILLNEYDPKPSNKGKTVFFGLCFQLKGGIAWIPPIKVSKKFYVCIIIYVGSLEGKAIVHGLRARGSIA